MDAAIHVDKLCRNFGALSAVDRLSFTVKPGEVFGLVGPDGAGKSTALRMLAGVLTPSSGAAWVAGLNVVDDAIKLKDHTAYMSQRFGLYTDLTVIENIEFYADLYGVSRQGRAEWVDELLSFSNMLPFKKRLAGALSGGMKQKLQLVCALIHKPDVLLLDEPTNGVDPISRRDFWHILAGLSSDGVTVLISTAYLDEAERMGRIGLMSGGCLIASGTPREVRSMMQGSLIEVRTAESRRGFGLLSGYFTSLSVNLFGDRVRIVTDDITRVSREVSLALDANNVAFEEITVVPPTLEDVFISMTGDEDG